MSRLEVSVGDSSSIVKTSQAEAVKLRSCEVGICKDAEKQNPRRCTGRLWGNGELYIYTVFVYFSVYQL
jgi:hypothetical protein